MKMCVMLTSITCKPSSFIMQDRSSSYACVSRHDSLYSRPWKWSGIFFLKSKRKTKLEWLKYFFVYCRHLMTSNEKSIVDGCVCFWQIIYLLVYLWQIIEQTSLTLIFTHYVTQYVKLDTNWDMIDFIKGLIMACKKALDVIVASLLHHLANASLGLFV